MAVAPAAAAAAARAAPAAAGTAPAATAAARAAPAAAGTAGAAAPAARRATAGTVPAMVERVSLAGPGEEGQRHQRAGRDLAKQFVHVDSPGMQRQMD